MALRSASAGNSSTAWRARRSSTGTEIVRSKPTRSRLAPMSTGPDGVPSTTADVSRPSESLATSVT